MAMDTDEVKSVGIRGERSGRVDVVVVGEVGGTGI